MFGELKDLGGTDPVDLYRLEGYADVAGHTHSVFSGPENVEVVIRPWQADMAQVVPQGQLGQTPGFKLYVDESTMLSRDDRIHWRGGPFRLMNPQYDELWGVERWDIQTDERRFRHVDDTPPEYLTEVDRDEDRYAGW